MSECESVSAPRERWKETCVRLKLLFCTAVIGVGGHRARESEPAAAGGSARGGSAEARTNETHCALGDATRRIASQRRATELASLASRVQRQRRAISARASPVFCSMSSPRLASLPFSSSHSLTYSLAGPAADAAETAEAGGVSCPREHSTRLYSTRTLRRRRRRSWSARIALHSARSQDCAYVCARATRVRQRLRPPPSAVGSPSGASGSVPLHVLFCTFSSLSSARSSLVGTFTVAHCVASRAEACAN